VTSPAASSDGGLSAFVEKLPPSALLAWSWKEPRCVHPAQRARQAVAAAGFEEVDQVRTTALSELGREMLTVAPVGTARSRVRSPARAGFALVDRNTVLAGMP